MRLSERHKGAALVLAAAVLWGTSGTAQSFAPEGADSRIVGALRLLVGGGALFAVAAWRGVIGSWTEWRARRRDLPLITVCALGLAAFQYTFFAAVRTAGVAAGTMVAIGSFPVFGALLARLVLGEQLRGRWWFATALAVGGCVCIALGGGSDGGAAGAARIRGLGLALLAGFSYAGYTLCLKDLMQRHASTAIVALMTAGGALVMLPELARCDPAWLLQGRTLAVALYLGLISLALPFFFFGQGLRRLPVAFAATLGLAEPLTAACLGLLLLGERPGGLGLTGLVLVFCGLLVLVSARPEDEDEDEDERNGEQRERTNP